MRNVRDGLKILGQKLDDLKASPAMDVHEMPALPNTFRRASAEVYFGFRGAARGTVVTFNSQKDKENLYIEGAGGGVFNSKVLPGYLNQEMQQAPITVRNPSEVPIQNLSITVSKRLEPVTLGNRYGAANDLLYDFSDLPAHAASSKEITVIVQISTRATAFDPTPLLVTVSGKGMSKHSEIMEYAVVPLPS